MWSTRVRSGPLWRLRGEATHRGGRRRERRTVRPGTAADKGGEGAYRRGTRREEWSIRDHHKGCGTRDAGSTRGHRCQACEAAGTHVRGGVGTPEEADVAWSGEVAA